MTTPARYRQENVCRSFQRMLDEQIVAQYGATYTDRVFWNDPLADPTRLDELATSLTYWLNVRFSSGGVGMKRPTEYLVDCYHYVGTDTSPDDRYGWEVTKSGSDLIGALHSVGDVGYPIYDYADVDAPVLVSPLEFFKVMANGQQGWPAERRFIGADRGLNLELITLHVWHVQDLNPRVQAYR